MRIKATRECAAADETMNIDCELTLVAAAGEALPTTVCFWIDPYWTGYWTEGVPHGNNRMRFRVKYRMTRMPSATLRPWNQGLEAMNPTVKLQFFMPLAQDGSVAVVQDFRYSASFPVALLFKEDKHEYVCGLWNENDDACNQEEGFFLPHTRLRVRTLAVSTCNAHVPPLHASLRVPNVESHRGVFEVANWIEDAFREAYPGVESIFFLPRTVGRNPFQDFFFTDAQAMYQTQGTNLPPTVALYALCNALIVQGLTLDTAERLLLCPPLTTKESVKRLLRLVRDVLMCFTLCPKEGRYRADMCMGKPTEDQPQCLQFTRPDVMRETIFGEDDCEGLDQQGCVHMVELFRAIATVGSRDKEDPAVVRLRAHFAQHAAESPLRLRPNTRERLLRLAIAIGQLFVDGTLEAHMCEGESLIARFDEALGGQTHNNNAEHEGHSFGMLLYEHGWLQGALLMENTGIECVQTRPKTAEEMRASAELASYARVHRNNFGMRVALAPSEEDRLYQKICMGKGVIFFTQRADGRLEYGASPSLVNTRFVRYGGGAPPDGGGEDYALLVPVETMLEAMCDGTGPWPRRKGAGDMLKSYRHLRELYTDFARIWMPPQDTEAEYMRRVCTHWGVLYEGDLITRDHARLGMLATVSHPQRRVEVHSWLQNHACWTYRMHSFMHSTIFLVFFPA